jgi:hypothetical protein
LADLLKVSAIHEIELTVAERVGDVRAGLLDRGITVGEIDLLTSLQLTSSQVTCHPDAVGQSQPDPAPAARACFVSCTEDSLQPVPGEGAMKRMRLLPNKSVPVGLATFIACK